MIFENFKIPGNFTTVKICIKNQVSSDLIVDQGHKRMIEKADKTRCKPADI